MIENRLFQILFLLLEKGSITAPELATRFEVSIRTIYRDIDKLSSAGVPIYTTSGKGGGIFLHEHYVLNKSLISDQEQNQILLALQGLNVANKDDTSDLLMKLGGIFKKQNSSWIEVDFSEWKKDSKDTFDKLQSAIFHCNKVSFEYYSRKHEYKKRTVEPLKLLFKNREWYVYAYCQMQQDYRLFKLKRIRNLVIKNDTFERSIPNDILNELHLYTCEEIELTLKFHKEMAYRVYENFDNVKETEDGYFIGTISLPDNESLFIFLLSFGDMVEVLSPLYIREKMINKIDKMKNLYKT